MFRATAPNLRSPIPAISLQKFIQAAAEGRTTQIYFYLMNNKDDPIAMNASWENGETALIAAVRHNRTGVVDKLRRLPTVNVNAADHDGNTPLIYAAVYGRVEIVKLLLAVSAININAVNQDGFTALAKAAMQGHIEVVKTLLAVPDINFSLVNIFGRNAAEEAIARSQPECARLIYAAATAASKTLPRDPLHCPFTLTTMQDPVTVSSGITYDRAALQNEFAKHPDAETIPCAVSGKHIHRSELHNATNVAMQKLIAERLAIKPEEEYPEFENLNFYGCTIS